MPLPGGATDKLGNRYEGRWTVNCIADVLDDRATSIRLEPPGAEGEGVEFYLRRNDIREYHQVKRQHSASGHWTLAELESTRVLSHFWQKLRETQTFCVFISSHAAFQLEELADRARSAATWEEFNREFLKADQHSANFNQLRSYWGNCSQTDAYEALKRIRVETVGEGFLRTTVESRLATLVEGNPATILDILAQLALDNVHQELTAHDIWHHLQTRGSHRCQWGKDPHILAAIAEATDRYLRPLRSMAIGGTPIPRDEAQTVFRLLTASESKRGVLLAGAAGAGKSGVIVQVVDAIREQGVPVIAFRVDRLEPTQLPDHVGQQIGLPGSPANVLAAIAEGRDCVLVIDQLDAVSLASGRHPQFFDCVDEIIKQAQAHPRMRLLLACRKFDIDNDHRIRGLTRPGSTVETLMVNKLSHTTVKQIIVKLGLNAEKLNNKQLDLLSIPLHLSLLAEVAADSNIDVLDFKTAKDLYYRFWERKQSVIRERLNRLVKWSQVVDALCDYMSDRQVLSVPEDIVEEYKDDAKAMTSEHVLIRDGHRYSFFHESFFDYAYARRFAARSHELLSLLKGSEQHLFRRAQVRQILLHERDTDHSRYLADLRELIARPDIRFHLKQVVLSLLAELADPTKEEWNIIAPLLDNQSDPYTQEVWRIFYRSVAWFELLDSLGMIKKWLADQSEERVNQVVRLLSTAQRKLPDRVAELIEPYFGKSEAWRDRLTTMMRGAELSAGRRFFDLFLRLIDEATLDEAKRNVTVFSNFWHTTIIFLPKNRPEWACEVISHYLTRCLTLSRTAGQCNPFDRDTGTIPNSQFADKILMESAQGAPSSFITHVLPFMLCVMELTAERKDDPPWTDPVWRYRHYDGGYGIDGALLKAMETALSNLANNEPEVFATLAKQLRNLDFETLQYLLIRAYAANGARFADEVVDYLCERSARLKTGYFSDEYYATRQLLEAITPYCSNEHLARLEKTILSYYPVWEKSTHGYRNRGYAQFVLLEGISPSRRSASLIRRLQEWQRKFDELIIEKPKSFEFTGVASPIPEVAAEKMTDEQWLQAIARYNRDDMHSRRDDIFVGGADQLSTVLESQVKKEPARFAKLIVRFPDDTHSYYFEAVLRGIVDAGLDIQTVLQVCQRCHQLPNRPCGRYICQLISKLAKLSLPKEALDIVTWYAANDPNPQQELWRTKTQDNGFYPGDTYNGGDPLTAGINSVRGKAAEALEQLIFYDGNRIVYLLPTLQQMVKDSSIATRSCVAATLVAVLKHDRKLAVNLFQQLCETEEILLGTHHVERFLLYSLQTHFDALGSILKRMIASELSQVAVAGARQACLASLGIEQAHPLAVLCLSGTDVQRLGATQIFVANLRQARFRLFCEEALKQFFNDPNEKVRTEAAKCFHNFEGEELKDYVGIIETFVQSSAFATNHFYLIHALENTTAKLPDVACLVCERFLDAVGLDAADTRTNSAVETHTVSQLLVRVYSQSDDKAIQARCLDLIDRMTQMEVYGLDEALDSFNR